MSLSYNEIYNLNTIMHLQPVSDSYTFSIYLDLLHFLSNKLSYVNKDFTMVLYIMIKVHNKYQLIQVF
jgi:hypothetical protein